MSDHRHAHRSRQRRLVVALLAIVTVVASLLSAVVTGGSRASADPASLPGLWTDSGTTPNLANPTLPYSDPNVTTYSTAAGPGGTNNLTISKDTVWTKTSYTVNGLLIIQANASLTIEAGTTVTFQGVASGIQVNGSLLSLGTVARRVTLRGESAPIQSGTWTGISINPTALDARTSPVSVFDYTTISSAGYSTSTAPNCWNNPGAVNLSGVNARLVMSNSSISYSAGAALRLKESGSASFAGIYDDTFDSETCGVSINGNTLGATDAATGTYYVDGNTFGSGLSATALYAPQVKSPGALWARYNTFNATPDIGYIGTPVPSVTVKYNNFSVGVATPADDVSAATQASYANNYWTTSPLPAAAVQPLNAQVTTQVAAARAQQDQAMYGSVNTATGALIYQEQDLAVSSGGVQVPLTRTYESQSPTVRNTDFGPDWSSSLDSYYNSAAAGASTVVGGMTNGAGTEYDFRQDTIGGTAVQVPIPGSPVSYRLGTQAGIDVGLPDGTQYGFNSSTGLLIGQTLTNDPRNNLVASTNASNQVTYAGLGRSLTLSFVGSPTTTSSHVGSAANQDSSASVSYINGGPGGRLSQVTGVDSSTEAYTYDPTTNLLTSATITPSGTGTQTPMIVLAADYTSDTSPKVSDVTLRDGGKASFSYYPSQDTTVVSMGVTTSGTTTSSLGQIKQEYDSADRLVQSTPEGSDGTVGDGGEHIVYDADGNPVVTVNGLPAGDQSGYGASAATSFYNWTGDPILSVDALGRATSTGYTARHSVLDVIYPDGSVVDNAINTVSSAPQATMTSGAASIQMTGDRLDSTTDQNLDSWDYTYSTTGGQLSGITESGLATGAVLGVDSPVTGRAWKLSYATVNGAQTNPAGTQPATGQPTNLTGRIGDLLSESEVTAGITKLPAYFGYDANGNVTDTETPQKEVTTYTYTSWGALMTKQSPLQTTVGVHTSYNYDGYRRLVSVVTPGVPTVTTTCTAWDSTNRDLCTATALGSDQTTAVGTVSDGTKPAPLTTSTAYDALARPTSSTDANGNTRYFSYTANEGWPSVTTDPQGLATKTIDDPAGRPVQVSAPYCAVATAAATSCAAAQQPVYTQSDYDRDGEVTDEQTPGLTLVSDAGVATTSYCYNDMGQIRLLVPPKASTSSPCTSTTLTASTVYQYSLAGFSAANKYVPPAVTVTNAVNQVTTTTFDAYGRPVTTSDPRNNTTTVNYNDTARTVATSDGAGAVSTVGYDADGRLISSADGLGNTTTYTYDGDNNITSETDPCGQLIATGCNSSDRPPCPSSLTSCPTGATPCPATCPATATRAMAYLANDALSTTTSVQSFDANGTPQAQMTSDTYDPFGRLRTESWIGAGSLGGQYAYQYDNDGNVTSFTDRTGKETQTSYDSDERPVTVTDPNNHATTYTYSNGVRQLRVADATSVPATTNYDPTGRPLVQYDGQGDASYTYYSPDGMVAKTTDPDSVTTTNSYNAIDQLVRVSGQGVTTSYSDDGNTQTAVRGNGATSTQITTTNCYDVRGRLDESFDDLGNPTYYQYNAANEAIKEYDPAQNAPTSGSAATVTACPASNATPSYPISGAGAITPKTFSYDAGGELTSAADQLNNTSHYTYNASGDLTRQTLPKGASYTYGFDIDDYLTSQQDPTGDTTYYVPDASGQVRVTDTPISGSGSSSVWHSVKNTYDNDGQLTCQQAQSFMQATAPTTSDVTSTACGSSGNESTRVLSYDAAGRPTGLSGGTAGTDGLGYVMSSSYTYDIGSTGTGRLTESDDPQATTSYTYVPSGDLASRTIVDPADSFSTRTNYSYGTSGRLSTLASGQYNGNTAGTITATGAENLTYNYDGNGLGQLVSESISGKTPSSCAGTVASTTVYCYDADGRTSSEKTTDSNSTLIYATAATYTPAGQTATLTKKTPDTSTTNANSTGYNSDSGGRSYTYQGNGTLHSSTVTEPSSLPDAYTEYDWDADGDPSGVKVGATSAGPFPINSTYQYVTNGGNETDEIATYTSGGNVTTVTHDAAGDETGDTGGTNPTATSYKYDNFGQLKSTSWTGSGGVTTTNSLGYDALGRLSRATQGTSSSVFYDYDGLSNNVADSSAATLMVGYVQDPDGDTTGDEVGTNAAQRYITDMHGDLAAKTDTSAGNIDNSIIYNANGQYRSAATSTPPQTFQSDLTTVLGKQSSEPNTLITMGTRQYAPAQTQFLTPDQNIGDLTNPISQNRYAYADNSPLDNDDPTGNAAEPTQDASPDAPSAGTGQSLLDPPTSTGGPSQAGPSTSADWGSAANGSCISDQPESVAGQFYINQESRFRQPEVCGGAGPSMYNPSTSPISDAGDDMYVLDLGAEIAAAIAGGYDEDPDLDLLDPTWYGDGLDASASQAATPPYTMDDDRYNDAIALVNDPFFDLPSYSPNMSAVLSASVPIDLGASVVDDLTNGPAFSPPVASLPAPIDAATWLREAISPLPGPPAGIQDTQFFGKNTEVSLTAAYYREYRARRAKGPIVRRNTVPSRSEGYQREYRARRVGDTPSAQLFEVAQLWADAVAASNARPILAVMNRFNMASTNAWTLVSRARQAGLIPPAVRDPAFSREDIAQVWADAVAASDPDPVSAVMNLFQLTRPGARRWIGRARSAGLIPPKG